MTRASSAGTPGDALEDGERVAGLEHAGKPLAREHAARVIVGGHDGRLAGPVGQVVVHEDDLDPASTAASSAGWTCGPVGVTAMPCTPWATIDSMSAICPHGRRLPRPGR